MTTRNLKFRGTPGPWRVDGHEHKNGVVEYTIVSISGDAVGCAPVAEVLRNNPRPMPEQRIEANARLLAAARQTATTTAGGGKANAAKSQSRVQQRIAELEAAHQKTE